VPCAIQYKINICCYFSKLKSDVKLFLLQGDSGTKKDFFFFFPPLSPYQGGHILCQEGYEKILGGTEVNPVKAIQWR